MPNVNFDFSGRSVIVTGAARGIGRALSKRFVEAGASVCMVDIDEDTLYQAATWAGTRFACGDVTDPGEAQRVVEGVVGTTGRIDVLVNNAGLIRDRVLWKLDDVDWDAVIAVNLTGAFNLTRACVPHFRERAYGRIVNVTSYSGLRGNVGQAPYAAAKAGVVGFTKTAAKELAAFGITVNAISPQAHTRMIESMPEEKRQAMLAHVPAGRFATPDEIAPGAMFLASEEAAYVTGAVLRIDGGLAM